MSHQLWATAAPPDHVTAAMACTAHAITEAGLIPDAEEDWDLVQAIACLNQAQEHLNSWQNRGN
ncbi:MAG TPA: hypothetical protein VEZ50_15940 [Nodosilinea sp.]|nr:hypothetical protein [Nodosilinea sp.]